MAYCTYLLLVVGSGEHDSSCFIDIIEGMRVKRGIGAHRGDRGFEGDSKSFFSA